MYLATANRAYDGNQRAALNRHIDVLHLERLARTGQWRRGAHSLRYFDSLLALALAFASLFLVPALLLHRSLLPFESRILDLERQGLGGVGLKSSALHDLGVEDV